MRRAFFGNSILGFSGMVQNALLDWAIMGGIGGIWIVLGMTVDRGP
jgi:hypothetical protein